MEVIWYQHKSLKQITKTHNLLSLFGICISAHHTPNVIQDFWLISKAIIQNGKENMILETSYKTMVNF